MAGTDLTEWYSGWRTEESGAGVLRMEDGFTDRLALMFEAMPPELQGGITILSGYRSVAIQEELWRNALRKYGSAEKARKWVAPPGKSNHGRGTAADLTYKTHAAKVWAHANAARFGLAFNLSNEDWHIEPAGLRNGTYIPGTTTNEDGTPTPRAPMVPDEEAYTDGQGLNNDNKTDPTVQLSRMAALMQGNGNYSSLRKLKQVDPRALANRNKQQLGPQ